jgi:hypothetical protein
MMDLQTFLYIVGAGLVPVLGFFIRSHMVHTEMHRKIDRILESTVGMTEVIADNSRALRALTHYIKWLEVKNGGQIPPPPLEDD